MFKKRTPEEAQKKAFAKIIRDARNNIGYTQERLAESMECSVRWLSQIEEGRSSPNDMDTIRLLAILKLSPEEVAREVGLNVPVFADRK